MFDKQDLTLAKGPISITRNAIHAKTGFARMRGMLHKSGYMQTGDFRLEKEAHDPDRRIGELGIEERSRRHDMMASFQGEITDIWGDDNAKRYKCLIACHGKLLKGLSRGGVDTQEGFGGLATIEEDMAVFLSQVGSRDTDQGARAVIGFAADSNDRSVFDHMHRGYEGLASPLGSKFTQPFHEIVHGLWRNDNISEEDPRLAFLSQDSGRYGFDDMKGEKFLHTSCQRLLGDAMLKTDRYPDQELWGGNAIRSGMENVKEAIIGLSNTKGRGHAASMHHHGNIMAAMAITSEQIGLNLANQGESPDKTGEFFAIADHATKRGVFYNIEERKLSANRQDDRTLC